MRSLELASLPASTAMKRSSRDARRGYFGMKCVGSQRVTGDNFNRMNTIPSDSSIPGETLFWGDALQGSRHSGKKIAHSWKKHGGHI